MKALTKSALSIAISSALFTNMAMAAEQPVASKKTTGKEDVEVIEVRGIRSSLVKSLEIKRESIGVTEAISAADIGKMPDQNIAESLQRLTGVQIDRNAGEGTRVRIRGMDNNLTLLNQSAFVTGLEYYQLGEGRSEFKDSLEGIPSEMLGGVEVYKTPTAKLIEGGVGGVVNLRTRSPFSIQDTFIAGNIKADYGSDAEEWKPQGVLAVGQNWGEFAALATITANEKQVHSDEAQNINRQGWEWRETADGEGYIIPGMQYETDREYNKKRYGATVSLGWRPTDDLELTFDYFHSELKIDSRDYAMKYAMAIDGGLDETQPYDIDENGVIRSATFNQSAGETNSSRDKTEIKTDNYYFNVDYTINDDWKIDGSISYADSNLDKKAAYADSRYTPYGVAGFIGDTADSGNGSGSIVPNAVDGDDADRSYTFEGGGMPDINFLDDTPLIDRDYQMYKSHWGFADETNDYTFTSALNSEYYANMGDFKTLKFGGRYAKNSVSFKQGRYLSDLSQNGASADFDPNNDYGYEAGSVAPDGYNLGDIDGDGISDNQNWGSRYYYLDAAIGNMGFEGTTSTGQSVFEALNGVGGWLWGGSPSTMPIDTFNSDPERGILVKDWFPSDGGSVTEALFQDTSKMGNPKKWLEQLSGASVDLYSMPLESWKVKVETSAFYVEADFEGDDIPYSLNVGVRAVYTDLTVQGAEASPQNNEIWGTHTWNGTYKTWTDTEFKDDYWEALPSMNFSYELDEDRIIRVSAARVMSRPSNQDLGRGFGTEFVRNDKDQYIFSSGSAGNAHLDPFIANQFDVAYEWYMDELSYLAVGAFYKDVDSFIVSSTVGEFVADDSDAGETKAGVTRPYNGDGGKVQGMEFAFQKGFENGLGVIVNYTYSDSETNENSLTDSDLQLPGVSEHAYNIIGFYEKDGLNARIAYSWRDDYLSPDNTFISITGLTDQFGEGNDRPLANYYEDYGQLDASISYDITENFTLMLEGINLTEEEQNRYAEYKNLFRSHTSGESRYIAGIGFRF